MSAELIQALDALAQRILAIAAQDAELRSHLRVLAQAILSATAEPSAAVPVPAEPQQGPAVPLPVEAVPPPSPALVEALPAGSPEGNAVVPESVPLAPAAAFVAGPPPARSLPVAEVRPRTWAAPVTDADLPLIEARCRLKAEGARWAVNRRRRLAEGAEFRTEIEPQDREMIARAKELPDCFLWMNHPDGPSPTDLSLLEDVAGCFEVVADAIALVRSTMAALENNQDVFEQVLALTAEAQSTLRAAILRIDGPTDRDQAQVYSWLRTTTREQQIYLPRFMRGNDLADPTGWADLEARLNALGGQVEETRKRANFRRKTLSKLRYIAKKIAEDGEAGQQERWQSLAATADDLVRTGVPPSNLEIRELLLPLVDQMPELPEMPQGFRLVLREIDRYLASRPGTPRVEAPPERSPEVTEAARLLAGKSMVLIGGDRRPNALESLKTSLGLKELYWIETSEHQSLEEFEPWVARPDVALVLLAIRWSSHSFGDVRQFCERHGKPLVRLPAGYHPNQVAYQILLQCSDQLAPNT